MSSEKQPAGGALLGALDSETAHHPQAMYEMLRENAPVMKDEATGVVVSRASDIERILQDPELFSSGKGAPSFGNLRPMIPLQIDPPEHRSYRKLLNPLFSLQRMAELEESMIMLVNELLDTFVDEQEIDFVSQFSQVFPSQVFLTMLGLSMDELPELLDMKDGIIRPHLKIGADMFSPEANAYRDATGLKVYEYFSDVLDQLEPGGEDLLSRLLETEIDGERLSREEVLDVCFVFLIAGLDTVSASLECFYSYLADHPEFRAEIVRDPASIPSVVEELLRWESPVMVVGRTATADTEISGCPVDAGEQILLIIGSANTDDEAIEEAQDVTWDRTPNRHVAFGGGIHRCLGSHLARLELLVALREWHARIPHYQVKPGIALEFTPGIRSLETFPMVLGVSS